MEEFAFEKFQSFHQYFEELAFERGHHSRKPFGTEHRRLDAEEIFDQTTLNGDLEDANDPESILLKSTILAKFMTLD